MIVSVMWGEMGSQFQYKIKTTYNNNNKKKKHDINQMNIRSEFLSTLIYITLITKQFTNTL